MLLKDIDFSLTWNKELSKLCTLLANIYTFNLGYLPKSPFERFIKQIIIHPEIESRIYEYYSNQLQLKFTSTTYSIKEIDLAISNFEYWFKSKSDSLSIKLKEYFKQENRMKDDNLILNASNYQSYLYLFDELVYLTATQSAEKSDYISNIEVVGRKVNHSKEEVIILLGDYLKYQQIIKLLNNIKEKYLSGEIAFGKKRLINSSEINDKIDLLFNSRNETYSRKKIRENLHELYDISSLEKKQVQKTINNKLNHLSKSYNIEK